MHLRAGKKTIFQVAINMIKEAIRSPTAPFDLQRPGKVKLEVTYISSPHIWDIVELAILVILVKTNRKSYKLPHHHVTQIWLWDANLTLEGQVQGHSIMDLMAEALIF